MSEKWTPGPWSAGHLGSDLRCQCRFVFCDQYMGAVAEVHVDNGLTVGEGGNDDPPLSEAVANMHLIAAAPELYAALSCFLDDPRFQVGVGGNPNVVVAMISAARAALAKARGETVDG